jgi:hypothetical protein
MSFGGVLGEFCCVFGWLGCGDGELGMRRASARSFFSNSLTNFVFESVEEVGFESFVNRQLGRIDLSQFAVGGDGMEGEGRW